MLNLAHDNFNTIKALLINQFWLLGKNHNWDLHDEILWVPFLRISRKWITLLRWTKVRVSRLITLWRTMKEKKRWSTVNDVFHERRRDEQVNAYVNRRERKETTVNGLYGIGERSREEAKNWRTVRKMRETRGDFSDRTALENCGFELACTISRCLLHPSACGAKREEGVPRDRDNRGPGGGLHTSACRETHPSDVSELSANRISAFYRRHNLPRCDVHFKEKGGSKGLVTGLSWCTGRGGEKVRGWQRWRRKVQDNKNERPYFDPINRIERLLWKSVVSSDISR